VRRPYEIVERGVCSEANDWPVIGKQCSEALLIESKNKTVLSEKRACFCSWSMRPIGVTLRKLLEAHSEFFKCAWEVRGQPPVVGEQTSPRRCNPCRRKRPSKAESQSKI
jgi:hypothetical protein